MNAVLAFIRLGRPLFLGGGFLMFALGAAIAARHGHAIDWRRYALGQGAVTAFQWMTHYANDYFDFTVDAANQTPTRWSGGSRMLVSGQLPRSVALIASLVFAIIGILLTTVLSQTEGVWITVTLLAILVLAWGYSAPPLRLCARGLGEIDTAMVVTLLVPWLGFCLQAADLAGLRMLLLAIAPLALLQFAMLLAVEIPDAIGDAATGKRTLVVRWGVERTVRVYAAITAIAYLWFPIAVPLGLPTRVALIGLLPVPLALWQMVGMADHRRRAALETFTLLSVLLLIVTTTAELAAFGL